MGISGECFPMEVFTLSTELRRTLPSIDLSEDIVDQLVEVLQRPRTLYRLLSQTLKLADGQLFLTLPLSSNLSHVNLRYRGMARRGESLKILGSICSQYTQIPHHSVLLDNGMHRPSNRTLAQAQYRFLAVENDALYCLDRAEVSHDELEGFIWCGASGHFSVGILTNCSVSENGAGSIALESLIEAVQRTEGVIFSVCDSEAFAIWCPKV